VGSATSARDFAAETLTQAEDRFRAGVATTVELVQAQESVARASEQYITSVYAHNIAKAQFARALGEGESRLLTFHRRISVMAGLKSLQSRLGIALVAVVVLGIAGFFTWRYFSVRETTDDAQVSGT
jgi:multidrug resistance efflux pump